MPDTKESQPGRLSTMESKPGRMPGITNPTMHHLKTWRDHTTKTILDPQWNVAGNAHPKNASTQALLINIIELPATWIRRRTKKHVKCGQMPDQIRSLIIYLTLGKNYIVLVRWKGIVPPSKGQHMENRRGEPLSPPSSQHTVSRYRSSFRRFQT